MARRATIVVLIAILFLTATLLAQDFQVVVNRSNPVSSMSKQELSRIFFKKTKLWDNGKKVAPVDQVASSSVRQRFSQEVFGKSTAAVVSYWQDLFFSGRATPPSQLRSSAEVLAFVRSNPDAIGYVSSSTSVGSGVKVIDITE